MEGQLRAKAGGREPDLAMEGQLRAKAGGREPDAIGRTSSIYINATLFCH
ncbi:MAG: hypothetical protein ACM3X9_05480 [Bacillota bacterium]